ncbi:MAG: acylneuraminate cytidylyltransferase family protein [Candidatus Methanofastidiosum sp.]|nr:acylneuraminate cytidylyltransferase family protein [Methanofastidiosum sp.]
MIAIIPARGGSKGVPNKNIKLFCGVPLIVYTIRAAKLAESVSRIIVSTDSDQIAEIVRREGAEIPFMRPNHLASDTALALDTYIYTCERLMETEGIEIESFMVLQPTSPLRTQEDIDEAYKIFKQNDADSIISVSEALHPPAWFRYIDESGRLRAYDNLIKGDVKNRQDYLQAFIPNGAIFIFKYLFLKNTRSYYSNKTYPYIMPPERSIDIDNPIDFSFGEFLYKNNQQN